MKINNLSLLTILGVLLLSACGGIDSDSVGTISDREKVQIIHDMNSEICENPLFKSSLEEDGVKNVLIKSTENTVTCATYDKIEGDPDDETTECTDGTLAELEAELGEDFSVYEDVTKACVIGFNP